MKRLLSAMKSVRGRSKPEQQDELVEDKLAEVEPVEEGLIEENSAEDRSGAERPADRLTLVEDYHYKHFPSPDGSTKVLAIFYSPIFAAPPSLPYFKQTQDLSCGRLLINPFTPQFYQDRIGSVEAIVARVGAAYDETVHYGFSMGAYAALRFGATDPKAKLVVAMSPHFVLDRDGGRSAQLMTEPPSPPDNDVRPFLAETAGKTIILFLSCLDVDDGIQIEDSLAIEAPNVTKYYALDRHLLPIVNIPNKVIGDYLKDGALPSLDPEYFANAIDIADSIAAFHLKKFLLTGMGHAEAAPRRDSRIPQYNYMVGMQALQNGNRWDAVQWLIRAVHTNLRWNLYVPLYAITLGKVLTELGYHEPGLGFFRHFHSHERAADAAYLNEAKTLLKLGRNNEIRVLADYYELKHGGSTVASDIRAMVGSPDDDASLDNADPVTTSMVTLRKALARLQAAAAQEPPAAPAAPLARDERELIEGTHYELRHDPGGDPQVLAIFYGNSNARTLDVFAGAAKVRCDRLHINPLSSEYYQDCLPAVARLIETIGTRYERTVHFGFSMGGYAALRFGATDPKAAAMFAISPPLVLNRRYGRSGTVMRTQPAPDENDVRPFVAACGDKRVVIGLSCLDTEDGATLADARSLTQPHITIHRVMQPHGLPALVDAAMLFDAYASGVPVSLDERLVASDEDVMDSIQAAEIMAKIHDGGHYTLAETQAGSRIPQYHYWVARHFARLRRPWEAIAWYARALEQGRAWNVDRPDYAISLANVLTEVGFPEAALGFYRHLHDVRPPVATAFQCEANLSRNLGRMDEVRHLAMTYRQRFGDQDGVARKLEETVAGSA